MDLVLVTKDQHLYEQLEQSLSGWGYRVIWGKSQKEALSLLSAVGAPVLALIDEHIDEENGMSVVRSLRRRAQAPYQYLIVLSDCHNQNELRSLLFGADAYISKPIEQLKLRVQVHVARRIMSRHIQAQQQQEELWNQANIDLLTGIPNRRAIFKALEKRFKNIKKL